MRSPHENQDLWRVLDRLDELAVWVGRVPEGPVHRELDRIATELESELTRQLFVPLALLEKKITALVDQLARQLKKKVKVRFHGFSEIEVQRPMRDAIQDVLVHAVRNGIDHGIEDSAVREAKGKSSEGELSISLSLIGSRVDLKICDDGAGFDPKLLLTRTGRSPEQILSDEAMQEFFFASGSSTREGASEISGRGQGLPGIRRLARDLGGEARIGFDPGRESWLKVELPVEAVALDAVFIEAPTRHWIPFSWGAKLPEGAMSSEPRFQIFRIWSSTHSGSDPKGGSIFAARSPDGQELVPLLDESTFKRLFGHSPRAACEAGAGA